jgi:lipoprotein-releasing system ATP-binding protein
MSDDALILRSVWRRFEQGGGTLEVLRGADLTIGKGELVALVGPSGAGKSTLLHIAGLLERPSEGEVIIAGEQAGSLNDTERTLLRRAHLGFVYQYHHLLPEFTAAENVVLPQMINGVSRRQGLVRARELLAAMGLEPRMGHQPGQLSGGEQQRVAICRALANRPALLLADEPTGNLDPNTSETVFQELLRLVRTEGLSALIATHNPELAKRMDRMITLRDGLLHEVTA